MFLSTSLTRASLVVYWTAFFSLVVANNDGCKQAKKPNFIYIITDDQ
jgi:hypothetical protein